MIVEWHLVAVCGGGWGCVEGNAYQLNGTLWWCVEVVGGAQKEMHDG